MNVAIINCFDTYEHRVDLLINYFKKRNDRVHVYTSDFRHIEKVKRSEPKKGYTFIEVPKYKKNISVNRIYSHYSFAKSVFKRIKNQKVDLLWILVPPNYLIKEAKAYKDSNPSVKVIFDIIDMWPETMPVQKIESLYPIKMWKNLRDANIAIADHVVTECDLFQTCLNNVDPKFITTLYLAREIRSFQGKVDVPNDKISLCYLGSINNIIDIDAICKIVQNLSTLKPVELHIVGDGERREEFLLALKKVKVTVVYHGKVYDSVEKQKIFDQCHFGLNIMKKTVFVGLTMKSMDYFEAGLPILNNIDGDTWKIVQERGIGVNISEATEYSDIFPYNADMRNCVREFFEQTFSIDVFEKKVDMILEKVGIAYEDLKLQ